MAYQYEHEPLTREEATRPAVVCEGPDEKLLVVGVTIAVTYSRPIPRSPLYE